MRVFAVSTGSSYLVMPGGLSRISASLSNMVVSMQRGGGSKDTWVLGDGPAPEFSLLRPPAHPLEVSRATFDLPSRVADNLFWLGRYTERVEAVVRTHPRHAGPRVPGRRQRARRGLEPGLACFAGDGIPAGAERQRTRPNAI